MAVRCKEEAEKVFGDLFDTFAEIVRDSVQFYYRFYGERAHTHEPWTRASIIRDEIKERMTALAASTPGLTLLRDGNATFFGAFSKFTIRIKKLFVNLHANTGKTQYSLQFDHQEPVQVDLFGDAELTNLYLGYVATENDPLNPPIYLVCNDTAGEVAWSVPLHTRPPSGGAGVTPLPAVPPTPPAPRRVRLKNPNKKAGNE